MMDWVWIVAGCAFLLGVRFTVFPFDSENNKARFVLICGGCSVFCCAMYLLCEGAELIGFMAENPVWASLFSLSVLCGIAYVVRTLWRRRSVDNALLRGILDAKIDANPKGQFIDRILISGAGLIGIASMIWLIAMAHEKVT
jgi:hypothetical protein